MILLMFPFPLESATRNSQAEIYSRIVLPVAHQFDIGFDERTETLSWNLS